MSPERDLARELTGLVVDGINVDPDPVNCGRCGEGSGLTAGDRVTATIAYYENHTWEPTGVYCPDHPATSVADDMGVAAEDQVVIAATLERTGYLDPAGEFHPDALTFGGVEVLDYSPAAEGYE